MTTSPKKTDGKPDQFDAVLKRMLSTPPQPKVKPKPEEKTDKSKPAK
jgi:hypothetical protein